MLREDSPKQPPRSPFVFGVATSDHQAEAYDPEFDDIWDLWERRTACTQRGRATDLWNRYLDDVKLAQAIGCRMFRFSTSWARLEPNPGRYNDKAFEHYRLLLEAIRSAGMEPMLTLHHFVWPIHIEAAGGMIAAEFPAKFAQYAGEVAARIGTGVKYWITFNEPNVLTFGYVKPWWQSTYIRPPGLPATATLTDQTEAVAKLIRNLFLAHTAARKAVQDAVPGAKVSANAGVLGLPPWLQRWIDRNATRASDLQELTKQMDRWTSPALPQRGSVDLMLGMLTRTKERARQVDFSDSYHIAGQALMVRSANPIETADQIRNGAVVVVKSSTAETNLRSLFPQARPFVVRDYAAAMRALDRDQAVALLADDAILQGLMRQRPGVYRQLVQGLTREPYAVAITKGNPQLFAAVSEALEGFVTSGAWESSFRSNLPGDQLPGRPVISVGATLSDLNVRPELHSAATARDGFPPAMPKTLLRRIQDRGHLIVGVRQDVPGFSHRDPVTGVWSGLEIDLAKAISRYIFGDPNRVVFRPVTIQQRIPLIQSVLRVFQPILRILSIVAALIATNWWYLGMSGQLPSFLCPPECVGQFDFVGFDYYWGASSFRIHRIGALLSALASLSYESAPVWPRGLYSYLKLYSKMFPDKDIVIVENGSIDTADGVARSDYIDQHIRMVRRALDEGIRVTGYIWWSITSNREWGAQFTAGNDFGIYTIQLDTDPDLGRMSTSAVDAYRTAISSAGQR